MVKKIRYKHLTPEFSFINRVLIIFKMFVGRIIPLTVTVTFAITITIRPKPDTIRRKARYHRV